MGIIEHIFYLCIVYIVFNLIWGIMVQLPKMALFGLSTNPTIDHIIKALRYLLISTLTYSTCNSYIQNHPVSSSMIIGIYLSGGVILSLYLAGKLNKKQSILKFAATITSNMKFNKNNKIQQLNYESHIVGVSIVIFATCVGIPAIGQIMGENPLNLWFISTIEDIYQTPILKWILGLSGMIFLLSMFQRSIVTVQQLLLKISGKKTNNDSHDPLQNIMDEFEKMKTQNNPSQTTNKKVDIEDDLYVDFEELNDDEKEEK